MKVKTKLPYSNYEVSVRLKPHVAKYVKKQRKAGKLVGPVNGNFYFKYDGSGKKGKFKTTRKEMVECVRMLGN